MLLRAAAALAAFGQVYRGDAENRNKVNLIVANEITPHLTAEEYLDKGEYENELKQARLCCFCTILNSSCVNATPCRRRVCAYCRGFGGADSVWVHGAVGDTYECLQRACARIRSAFVWYSIVV